ncbi:MAG: hypothetical protein ACOWWR_08445 [Eubacteriales bacterium]
MIKVLYDVDSSKIQKRHKKPSIEHEIFTCYLETEDHFIYLEVFKELLKFYNKGVLLKIKDDDKILSAFSDNDVLAQKKLLKPMTSKGMLIYKLGEYMAYYTNPDIVALFDIHRNFIEWNLILTNEEVDIFTKLINKNTYEILFNTKGCLINKFGLHNEFEITVNEKDKMNVVDSIRDGMMKTE